MKFAAVILFTILAVATANPIPVSKAPVSVTKTVAVPRVSYSKSYRPVQTVRPVTSYKPVVSYQPVTEYRTETSYQPQLTKHHSTQQVQVQVASGKGHRVLNPAPVALSKAPVLVSKAPVVQTKTVSVPRVSYSKSYRPVQTVRPVTSYKPVVTYKPVTEYRTETSYQPQLTKHHSTEHVQVQVAAGKGHRVLNPVPVLSKAPVAVSKAPVAVSKAPVAVSKTVAVPRVSYSKSYRPVQTVRPVTSYKPVVSYRPVTEYRTETSYQPQLTKHHSTEQVQVQVASGKGHRVLNPVPVLSKAPVAVSKAPVAVTKTVAVPRVSYSKSYRPVQTVRPVTSYKPVVTYRPVTEYRTETSYQPQLTKHHSTQQVQVQVAPVSSKGF